jgi:serine/threonine protein kinase
VDRAEPIEGVEIGETIGGYRLDRLLGAGSVSRVFLGTHLRLGRRAAIKVLLGPLADDARVTARFLNEARVVNDIRHPNIVDVSDFIESESPKRLALVMEYIEGPSLKTLIRSGHELTFVQAIGVALQLCAAVEAAHGAGVIHRDLKPDNLLLTADPALDPEAIPGLKVVDFGIAKIAGPGEKTATGMMIGTPAYMAPEQIAGKPPPSPATDIFAIGEVIYELLTGQRAYPASQISAMIQTKLKGELPKLEVPDVPGGIALRALVERCLQARPQDRPRLEEVQRVLIEVCPDAETGLASERSSAPLKAAVSSEEDTFEPIDTYVTKPADTTAPGPVLLAIPPATTSPTMLAPRSAPVPEINVPTELYSPAEVESTMLKPARPPARVPIWAYPAVAAIVALAAVLVVSSLRKPEPEPVIKATVPKIMEEPVVAVPAAVSGRKLSTEPPGARVEDATTGAYLGVTPVVVEPPAQGSRPLKLSMEGYETLHVELSSAGTNINVALTKLPEKPAKKAPKKTKTQEGWEW